MENGFESIELDGALELQSTEPLKIRGIAVTPGDYLYKTAEGVVKKIRLTAENVKEIAYQLAGKDFLDTHDEDSLGAVAGTVTKGEYYDNPPRAEFEADVISPHYIALFRAGKIKAFSIGLGFKNKVIDGVNTAISVIVNHLSPVKNPQDKQARLLTLLNQQVEGGEMDGDEGELDLAKWTRAFINDLPDSAFAVIEPAYKSGKTDNKNARHLPHHGADGKVDLSHLRNALARMNQIKPVTDSITADALRRQAKKHLTAHAKKLLPTSQWAKGAMSVEKEEIQALTLEEIKDHPEVIALNEKIEGLEKEKTELTGKLQAAEQALSEIQEAQKLELANQIVEAEKSAGKDVDDKRAEELKQLNLEQLEAKLAETKEWLALVKPEPDVKSAAGSEEADEEWSKLSLAEKIRKAGGLKT